MKLKIMLIGLALLLMLCISPVAAVSGTDFEIVTWQTDTWNVNSYKYSNTNNPDEEYIPIASLGSRKDSLVTFKPANIPDAPTMVADSTYMVHIFLPSSVGEWEIKYYSRFHYPPSLDDKYLKNAGVVNLKEYFGKYVMDGLYLDLIVHQRVISWAYSNLYWDIPSV